MRVRVALHAARAVAHLGRGAGGGALRVAHVGGGFNEKLLASIFKRLQPLKTDKGPFVQVPKTNEPVQWLKPKLVAEVKFSEWTAENRLRHPVFVGLREDKDPKDCRFEFESDTDVIVKKTEKRVRRTRPV